MNKPYLLLFFLILFWNCNTAKNLQVSSDEILQDLSYGKDPLQKMDVYLPANRNEETPFVVNIHGGAWTTGDKKEDDPFCHYLISKGIAVANINYRLTNQDGINLPEMLDDVDLAFNYIIQNSKNWNTRNTGFSITGMSSGGHQAMMYAYTRKNIIKSIVERAGVTNLVDEGFLVYIDQNNLTGLLNLVTGMPENWKFGDSYPEFYAQSSPVLLVKDIPILILHGDADDVVPIEQAYALEKELKSNDFVHKLIVIPNAGHDFEENEKSQKLVFQSAVDWFLKYGK